MVKLIKERKLMIDGVDIGAPNVEICKERIKKAGLEAFPGRLPRRAPLRRQDTPSCSWRASP